MAVTELALLGGFELRADGDIVDLPGQKDRALLAILALHPGAIHTRDKLAGLLWGDHGDRQARDSLKHAVIRLRQCVDPPPIAADRQSVRLNTAALAVDVARFETLLGDGTPEALERAASLYRGDLLDGFGLRDPAFEDWLAVERQRLRHAAEEALSRLMTRSVADGARERAATAARRLLSFDPLREAACRTLMQIEADRGQTTNALKLFETLRDRLHRELGVKPEPATMQLYESIRQRRVSRLLPAADPSLRPASAPEPDELPLPSRPSIAVLPFQNLSGDPERQYFSDGITEDIIIELSRFHSLFVIGRNSSFAFKGRSINVQDVARELGVAYVVEGSVRQAGDRVRITAQLIDGTSGNHLWAERYDRDMRDIFALQDEVARAVASTVSGRVEVAGRDRAVRLSSSALQAYDLILRAKALMLRYTRANSEQALACAERAVELDPSSARAHAQAAWCHFYNYMAWWAADRKSSFAKAFELAQQAVVRDEADSVARCILGLIHLMRRDYEEARSELEQSIALNPNDPEARHYYGLFLMATGKPDAGVEQIDLAKGLNPFDTRWVPWLRGAACFTAHRYDEAIASLRQARDPINEARGWLAASYAQAGRLQEARATLDEFLRVAETDMAIFPGRRLKDWEPYWHGALEYQDQRDFDHLFDALRKAGLPD